MQLQIVAVSVGSIGTDIASGTIIDDDVVAAISIADASVAEGNSGEQNLAFSITLSAASGLDAIVDYATVDGTAVSGEDYVAISGTALIPAGSVTAVIDVAILGDIDIEADEQFQVVLSNPVNVSIATGVATATIQNDDDGPVVSISDASVTEGNAGESQLSFVLLLAQSSTLDISVEYGTSTGSAEAINDFRAAAGVLTIPAGELQSTIEVAIFGDTLFELDETFSIDLSNPVNAVLGDANATGTISNDDVAPQLFIPCGSSAPR
jgi:hypothetical protein